LVWIETWYNKRVIPEHDRNPTVDGVDDSRGDSEDFPKMASKRSVRVGGAVVNTPVPR